MKNTTQQPSKWKQTGPFDKNGKFHSAKGVKLILLSLVGYIMGRVCNLIVLVLSFLYSQLLKKVEACSGKSVVR